MHRDGNRRTPTTTANGDDDDTHRQLTTFRKFLNLPRTSWCCQVLIYLLPSGIYDP
jgi:hypothetical protein